MYIRHKILGIYVLILLFGIGISAQIYLSGQAIDYTTRHLLGKNVPLLAHVNAIKNAMTEHERMYYEYYATTDNQLMRQQHEANHQRLLSSLDALTRALMDSSDLISSIALIDNIHQTANMLDLVLSSDDIDWDLSREKLVILSELGRQLIPHLDSLQTQLQNKVISTADLVQDNTQLTTRLVLAFSLLTLVIAALIAFYLDRYISATAERKRLAMYPERNPNPVLTVERDGAISYANPAAVTLASKITGDELSSIIEAQDFNCILPPYFSKDHKGIYQSNLEVFDWDYQVGDLVLSCHLHRLNDLNVSHLHFRDITDQYVAQERLEYLAFHDVLTELPNREQFNLTLQSLIDSKVTGSYGVAIIKLDRFNLITSGHGFTAGDAIIKALSKCINESCKEDKYEGSELFRFDGARFALMIPESMLASFSADINNRLEAPLHVNDTQFYVSLSIGYSVFPNDDNTVASLIQDADAAVIRAYTSGGNCCVRYTEDLRAQEQSWLSIETALRHAIKDNELMLYYQPQVDAKNHKIIGMEALLRWNSKDRGMVPPFEFIPVAEQTGLIVKVGEWVILEACSQAKKWQDQFKSNCVVAINISPKQFLHQDFLAVVSSTIKRTGVDPSLIEFEITEGVMVENTERCIEILQQLKTMGLYLSIDDFGTGYSSMSYLKRFPVDKLKIDQAFVRNLPDDHKDIAIVRSIIDLSHNLGLKVIAEGVETEGQQQLLHDYGCDEFQGYLFSKPKPSSEAALFLTCDEQSAIN